MLIDTHAHLDSDDFSTDLPEVLARAAAADVRLIVTSGADLESGHKAVALAEGNPQIYATVGIHPQEASRVPPDYLLQLQEWSAQARVVAIGEIGLDLYRRYAPLERQLDLFATQLELARRLNKPVVIHDREAHAETLATLREHGKGLRGVMHCFSGDLQTALAAIDMGLLIGLGGAVTFQNARRLQALVRELPLEHIVLETDCPYMAPHPYRGKRNEPAHVSLVAAQIASLQQLPPERVADVTTANAARLFGLSVP